MTSAEVQLLVAQARVEADNPSFKAGDPPRSWIDALVSVR